MTNPLNLTSMALMFRFERRGPLQALAIQLRQEAVKCGVLADGSVTRQGWKRTAHANVFTAPSLNPRES